MASIMTALGAQPISFCRKTLVINMSMVDQAMACIVGAEALP
jgi:hypothetical protein